MTRVAVAAAAVSSVRLGPRLLGVAFLEFLEEGLPGVLEVGVIDLVEQFAGGGMVLQLQAGLGGEEPHDLPLVVRPGEGREALPLFEGFDPIGVLDVEKALGVAKAQA